MSNSLKEQTKVQWVEGVVQKPNATSRKENPKTIEDAMKMVAPFVHTMAKKYTRNHYSYYEDFVAAGYEGALIAWEKFKGTKWEKQGYKYSSYSWWWIRERCQAAAKDLWGYKNATVSLSGTQSADEFVELNADTYEISTEIIDLKKSFSKLSELDQKLVERRVSGDTFDEIATELGFANLHKCRQRYMQIVETL